MNCTTELDRAKMTDLKIDLADGCDAVLDLLGQQLDNGNCNRIVRVDIGYFHSRRHGPAALNNARHDRFSRLSNDELNLVFQGVVCCLPKMKTLVVMSYFRADAMSLPVSALEMLFRRATCLEILFLHQIKLQGSPNDFRIMARSLDRHPALKRVNLHCCGASRDDVDFQQGQDVAAAQQNNSTSLDPLVCGLAKLPTMYYLSLDQVPISEQSIRALSQSPSLRDISFYNMPQIKTALPILFRTLQVHSHSSNGDNQCRSLSRCTLRGLRIRSCDLEQEEAILITKMLENNSSLESVVFYVDSWDDYGESLAAALAHNTSLKRLEVGIGKNQESENRTHVATREAAGASGANNNNHNNNRDATHNPNNSNLNDTTNSTDESIKTDLEKEVKAGVKHREAANRLAKALEKNRNTVLRHFCLNLFHADSNLIYDAFMSSFGTMLESNYVLENFLLQGSNSFSVMSPKVGFLLRLNQRSGLDRRKLFQDVVRHDANKADTRQLWVDTLEKHVEDVSIVYYLLQRNPNLVGSAVAALGTAYG
ncbi:expressed unknown protein [Seminavis robusta]|uniref:Uncharacterized protein n=1 Tax=Seminavis robusta TaxID=568900 RepID=A0A9N8H352_9STRA|nr:expressed unknown protein [Seminavis robusta]|eukprot:Sro20_g014180.1 n/a (538) ;mRNA; f:100143-101756